MLFDAVIAVLGRKEDQPTHIITRHTISEKRKLGQRLLLAEDNPVNQKLAIVLLQKAGYSVDVVNNGLLALEKVKAIQYSLVLMDVQMPDMDGIEATRQIRIWEQSNGQHIPIIAMTAHAMSGDRERCIESGMDDYVTKPLEPRVLFNAIDRWTQDSLPEKDIPAESMQDLSSVQQPAFTTNFGDDWSGENTFQAAPGPAPAVQTDSFADQLPADLEGALFRFDGDRAFMLEMCQEFRDHLLDRMAELKSAWQAGDMEKLGRHAHNIKGLSMNFNAGPVSALAAKLELCGKQKNMADAPMLVEQIESEIMRLREYLSIQLN
jgi:two-component system sensor histidine kinase/response regulator